MDFRMIIFRLTFTTADLYPNGGLNRRKLSHSQRSKPFQPAPKNAENNRRPDSVFESGFFCLGLSRVEKRNPAYEK